MYTIDQIKTMVAPIAIRYGAGEIKLYGDYARNEQTSESQIGLLLSEKGAIQGLTFFGMAEDIAGAFGGKADLVRPDRDDDFVKSFYAMIEREAIVVYDGTKGLE